MYCESSEGGNGIGLPLRVLCIVSQVRKWHCSATQGLVYCKSSEEMALVCHSGSCVL